MPRRRRDPDDFAAELEAHLDLERERLQAEEGLSAAEARAAAHRRFGNVTSVREQFFESRRWLWWDRVAQDVQYAVRTLRAAPGFTIVAVLTMAIGIGAASAMYTVVDATLLHPLPYPNPQELVRVEDDLAGVGARNVGMSQPEWRDLERAGIFAHISPVWFDENNLTGSSRPTRVRLMTVAPNYFAVLGVAPQIGRTFPPNDRSPGYTLEVVISDGLWQREFGRDPDILNRAVRLDTDLYRIVGVMPPGFRPPGRTPEERSVDVWAAMSFYGPPISDHPPRSGRNLPEAIGRLQPGTTIVDAQHRIDALVADLRTQYPADYPAHSAWTIRLVPLDVSIFGDVRRSVALLLGAVGLVLIVGCVNIANLQLARASTRGREFALRQALGAGRSRLIRQLVTESLCLSLAGGVAGVAILFLSKGFLLQLVPDGLPRLNEIAISWTALLFALAATALSGALVGLAPALHAGRLDLAGALKAEGRAAGSGASARTRRILVAAEFALSLVLMTAAGLLLRSFHDLAHAPLGFSPDHIVTVRTRLPYPNDARIDKYHVPAQEAPFLRELLRRARAVPGVEEAALGSSSAIPLDHAQRDLNLLPLAIEGRGIDPTQAPLVEGSAVTPEYFRLLGMTLTRGRAFTDADTDTTAAVAVINEAMARMFWPHQDPLGQHVKIARGATSWTTVIGVVADARTESLKDASVPKIYASAYQRVEKHLAIFVRGQLDAAASAERIRDQVQSIDPTLPVFGAQMLREAVSASLAERRFSMQVVAVFAVTALLLATIGIYGVISYVVSERTREIGIRLALGAEARTILRMVLALGARLTAAGAGVGLMCAFVVSRLMSGLLYGVRPTDPATFAAVATVLVAVALMACYIPARRAIRVDPMVALRHE